MFSVELSSTSSPFKPAPDAEPLRVVDLLCSDAARADRREVVELTPRRPPT